MSGHPDPTPPIVVVSALPGHIESTADLLEDAGCDVRRLPAGPFSWTPDTIARWIEPADALVGIFTTAPVTAEVLAQGERLRVVTSPIIGTETFDTDACTELGIVVGFGATEENFVGMAEAIVMLAAALRKQLPQKIAATLDGSWRPATGPGHLMRDATIGLLGYGAIGRATAQRLAGWGCRLVAHDPFIEPADAAGGGVELVSLDELLASADVVSIMVPLTDTTRNLIGADELARMKPGSHLINTSRGDIVDETALLAALDDGQLAGAAIDTWAEEGPATTSPLRGHPKVIATGHSVGHSQEVYDGHPIAACDNTMLALAGREPLHVRNPAVLVRWRARWEELERQRPLRVVDRA